MALGGNGARPYKEFPGVNRLNLRTNIIDCFLLANLCQEGSIALAY